MSKRSYGASIVLARMLNGDRLTAAQISFLANGEEQSRLMEELRKAFIPWECDQSTNDTVWFIPKIEIARYYNCRDEQIAEQKALYDAKKTIKLDKQLRKAIKWRGVQWLVDLINQQASNDDTYEKREGSEEK